MAIDITTPDVAGDADLASWVAITRAAGFDAWVATPTSANLRALITDEVGTGGLYFVGGALGTPASVTLTNATGLPVSTGLTGLGTGVATALGVNVGSAGAPVLYNGALGTPSSATLTNATGLPISTGVSGLGTGIATFLATPSSANLRAAVTDESGSGALLFAGGALGTPASGVLTNCTGLPNASVVGLGTAALVADNTLVHLAGAETISGAKTFSASPIMTASLDMRNDVRMTDAGTNRWAIGRGAGGGGAADDWQLYNYSGAVALRVTYSGNVASFTNTPLVGSDPVMTRGAAETITGAKSFSADVTLTVSLAALATNSAGFRGKPQRLVSGSTTLQISDAGGWVMMATGVAAQSITIPPNSSVAFPIGTEIVIGNRQDSNGITIVEGSGVTLRRGDGTPGTGTRTQTTNAFTTLFKNNTNDWFITGTFT